MGVYVRTNPASPQSLLDGEDNCLDPEAACTLEASASRRTVKTPSGAALFQGASDDGDKVFFRTAEQLIDADVDGDVTDPTGNDIYLFEPNSDALRRISFDEDPSDGIGRADVRQVIGLGEDGKSVYFAAKGRLVAGQPKATGMHLYLWQDDGSTAGSLTYITTLDEGLDNGIWSGQLENRRLFAQASPSGRYLAFKARTKLGGYESAGHTEIYRYDSRTKSSPARPAIPVAKWRAGRRRSTA